MGNELVTTIMTMSIFAALGFVNLFFGWLAYRLWCAGRKAVLVRLAIVIVVLSVTLLLYGMRQQDYDALLPLLAVFWLGLPSLFFGAIGVLFARRKLRKAAK
jgi:hypothetical protein